LYERFIEAGELAETSGFNIIEDNGSEVGVIGSGIGYHYARSILDRGRYSWLKLGFVNPFPESLVKKFAAKTNKIFVIEELRPFIENNVRRLNSGTIGKGELGLEELGELTPDILRKTLAEFGLCEGAEETYEMKLPSRPPVLCPGCPHRAFYYALNKVREDKIVTGDIGCYTLGVLPPLNAIQTCLCMGAGISQAAGMWHAGAEETIFAVIGDSTFFHTGMPHLLNLAYNKANVCVVILDNETVAMTGHQPTPESGSRAAGEKSKVIGIDNIAYSLGIDLVNVVDPYDIDGTVNAVKESINHDGPSVIISKRLCSLAVERGPVRMVSDECSSCGLCVRSLGCPAISMTPEGARIDPILCRGCGVCEVICPLNAIGSHAR